MVFLRPIAGRMPSKQKTGKSVGQFPASSRAVAMRGGGDTSRKPGGTGMAPRPVASRGAKRGTVPQGVICKTRYEYNILVGAPGRMLYADRDKRINGGTGFG